ncbi:MAG: hypothetical protein JO316_08670 [Abitibacteriaceae bacterium]|nr:hypothetical protein [Abditibacteriaceae bacterium]MBV9865408.1 hypothetical protein [Abditibacteriaceae bacterium]
MASPLELTQTWWNRVIYDEDIFLVLLGARWLSLLPPLLALLLHPESREAGLLMLGIACISNLLLSVWHPKINGRLQQQPLLLGLDFALVTILTALTGGTLSPYGLYAYTPLVLSAFFFQIRGGLIAATTFTPLYLLSIAVAQRLTGNQPDAIQALGHILSIYLVVLIFGYSAMLLQRVKQSALELQHTQAELAQAETLAAIGKMVGHLSHEIRNPLTTLGGYAYHLARKPDDAQMVAHHARIIGEEAHRLEELLTDMLNLTRPVKQSISTVNLHEILDKACVLAADQPQNSLVIEKQYDPTTPTVEADAASLLRAFLNVIRNAMQFMPDGGTLTVTTHTKPEEVEVAIQDTGPGIPPDVLPTIFKPFVTHRANGTGLGLPITQQVIEEHGGCIDVQSEFGHGACFTFRLPRHAAFAD